MNLESFRTRTDTAGTFDRPAGTPEWTEITVDRVTWLRGVVRTPWLQPSQSLPEVVRWAVGAHLRPGDTVAVTEKVAVLLTGRAVDASAVQAGRLARWLASRVRPVGNSRGLSVPEKMQYVLDARGRPRVLAAAAAAALTRPLGLHGAFYRIAGSLARDLDGLRPPYHHTLLPPLPGPVAQRLADELEATLGASVAIVDVNDRGGSIRAVSVTAPPAALVLRILADNPLGQRDHSTPLALLRPAVPSHPRRHS